MALQGALASGRQPEIFKTDQGSQFTSEAFTGELSSAGIAISMDGTEEDRYERVASDDLSAGGKMNGQGETAA